MRSRPTSNRIWITGLLAFGLLANGCGRKSDSQVAKAAAPQQEEVEIGYPKDQYTFGDGQVIWTLTDATGAILQENKTTLDYTPRTMTFQSALWLASAPLKQAENVEFEVILPFKASAYEVLGETYSWKTFAGGSDLSVGKNQGSLSKTLDSDGRLHFRLQVPTKDFLDPTSMDPGSFEIVLYDQTFLPFMSLRFYR